MKQRIRQILSCSVCLTLLALSFTACSPAAKSAGTPANANSSKQIVIYTNADDEAVEGFKNALDGSGYKGKYVIQGFGTSDLGGKLLAEGKNLEADLITMSSYYVDSAQAKNKMFKDLTFNAKPMDKTIPAYRSPTTSQEGAILLNTDALKTANLPMPASLKDLENPVYKGQISVPDVTQSSTAWLMVQALVSAYGEDQAQQILAGIYKNCGPHIEKSGSAPLKNVRAGSVAIGFGLRHQAVADKAKGLPIDFVDPSEGNFPLTESAAVLDKGDKTNPLAMEMAKCIIEKGRPILIKTYPNPLYEGEKADAANQSKYPKTFSQPLSVELLEKHQKISEAAKAAAQS